MKLFFSVLIGCVGFASMAFSETRAPTDSQFCSGLTKAVTSRAPAGKAIFLPSYEAGPGENNLPLGLASSAFVYDNALAAIALAACGDVANAQLIGNALRRAVRQDRTFADGRIRNAYRAGVLNEGAPLLPGWWDKQTNAWAEDAAQDGTSTGNVAWAALALLTLHQATGEEAYLADAERLMDWIVTNASCEGGRGFCGGFHGFDPNQVRLNWSSTEHNVDVYAVAQWLFRLTQKEKYRLAAAQSRLLLDTAFRGDSFLLGTKPDGSLADPAVIALDVQLWPWMAIPDAPKQWRTALGYSERHLAVDGGFDFDGDRDGVWVEGTAQASLAYRIAGDLARSEALLASLHADRSASGLLYATRKDRISTGLSIDPTSSARDFYYFRRPHLGATAWAALAAVAWNPFLGRKVD